ncbi:MAG TPA: OsmC family protein [Candidatus Baltobacteraceae bacterium]|nr:OsmC family protein [Candidatus Baltobacteraceae bacterium]
MAIQRKAEAVWTGGVPAGNGKIDFSSGALPQVPYSFGTRFGDEKGTNPEELIAAAHAACYSMALSAYLGSKGITANSVETRATCSIEKVGAGFKITRMLLQVTASVPEMKQSEFEQFAAEAEKSCPVSNALRNNLEIKLEPILSA